MSIQAYQQAAKKTANPREIEYRLFAQVTHALLSVKDTRLSDLKGFADTLDWNRRIWSALAMDCADPNNGMSEQLRAGIISLSMFVSKHTSLAIRGKEDVDTLIDINRMIMQGLSGGQAATGESPAQSMGDAAIEAGGAKPNAASAA